MKLITSRGLPKTGQTYEYCSGSDGDFQAGWWVRSKVYNNKTRFISKTIDGDDIVIDRATGLMWAADDNEAGCNNADPLVFVEACAYPLGITFAGYNDWRLPNIFELFSIVDYSNYDPTIDTNFFPNAISQDYWSSTAHPGDDNASCYVSFANGIVRQRQKTHPTALRCVRGGV